MLGRLGCPDKILKTWRVLPKGMKAAWVRRLAKNITHRRHEENMNAAQPRIMCRLLLSRDPPYDRPFRAAAGRLRPFALAATRAISSARKTPASGRWRAIIPPEESPAPSRYQHERTSEGDEPLARCRPGGRCCPTSCYSVELDAPETPPCTRPGRQSGQMPQRGRRFRGRTIGGCTNVRSAGRPIDQKPL